MQSAFKPLTWTHNTSIYEVNLRQYTREGNIESFRKHLPRLKEMGIHTLWFMPIQPIGKKNRKGTLGSYYSISDYTGINPEFGDETNFRQLVDEAHQKGFIVILDWVANHCSWDNIWTETHPEFFSRDEKGNFKPPFPNWEDVIHLDYQQQGLRQKMQESMLYWVQAFGIDGFRCDMAHLVALDFWKECRTAIDAFKPLFWLGEFDELEYPAYGEVFDASYSWTWMHKTEAFAREKINLKELIKVLKNYDDLGDRGMRIWFTSNHDENSWNGTEHEKYGGLAMALAVFSVTWNGIPLIYSGQEIPNHKRLRFFEKDEIEWSAHNELQDFYTTLLRLHSDHPALEGGNKEVITHTLKTSEPDKTFAYLRTHGTRAVLAILNFSGHAIPDFIIMDDRVAGSYMNVFTKEECKIEYGTSWELKGWDYRVFEK
ncbi:MAG TPA: alpha-amylase family glycosyl hydrolase [Chitinophagaceae bacterium]|nr:alpha-amylase family glycosyl hydrolase [Chitinophagaceae bacterium]